ncbi:MAG: GNAT family N-acetyltransferase [bacterium]|nr:GNAT family N-acetyltransferase [bacterium]
MGRVKVRKATREELPGIVVIRDAAAQSDGSFLSRPPVLDLDMDVDPELLHLLTHDPNGFFTAVESSETLGFAAAHIRSRQWILSELWVLPQHRNRGAGEALLSRALSYGNRSGAREYLAIVPVSGSMQSLLIRHDFVPLMPVYHVSIPCPEAATLSQSLVRLLPGQEVTSELLQRRGQADLDRLDKLGRGITREADHMFWLRNCGLRAAFVREGKRVAAYAYGGAGVAGPLTASTPDAALAGLGWSLHLADKRKNTSAIDIRMPASFDIGLQAVLEAGGRIDTTYMLFGRGVSTSLERLSFGPINLP